MTTDTRFRNFLLMALVVTMSLQAAATRYQDGDFIFDCNWSWGQLTATLLRYTGSQTEVDIPDTVEYDGNSYPVIYIGDEFSCPFADNDIIEVVRLPRTAQSIGVEAFSHCSRLHTVSLGRNLRQVGAYAFHQCTQLQSVRVYDLLTDIGDYAFAGCTALRNLTLGHAVSSLGQGMLDGCSLQSLTLLNPTPATCHGHLSSDNAFYMRCQLVLRLGTVADYQAAGGEWLRFRDIVERAESGDINADNNIDVTDINILINMMLSRTQPDIGRADIDHNGFLDITDVNALINLMLGK